MPVVPLTIVISLCLVFTFVMFFLRQHALGNVSSAERDALLPFAEENRQSAATDPRQTPPPTGDRSIPSA